MGKYRALAERISRDIETGKLKAGSKLPSVRNMAAQQQLSITTVLNCYRDLEQSGLIATRPKSGFFVASVSEQDKLEFPRFHSKIVTMNTLSKGNEEIKTNYSCYPLYTAQLSPAMSPHKALAKYVSRIAKSQFSDFMSYAQAPGLLQLRQVLAEHFTQKGLPLCARELIINNGCLDSVRLALEVTSNTDDVVAVNSPCYSGLLDLVGSMGRRIYEIPASDEGMDTHQLFEAMQSGKVKVCLLSANYQNPSGLSLSNQQKQAIAHMANKYQIPVIEDDVYLELCHSPPLSLPIKFWDQSGYVLWCSSVSKTVAAGLRLGWCAAGRYTAKMQQLRRVQSLGVNHIEQQVLTNYISSAQYQKHLAMLGKKLFILKNQYRQFLLKHLPANSKISNPKGGMVLWIQVPDLDSQALHQQLADKKVYVRAGTDFSSRGFYRDCFRINFSWPIEELEQDLITFCKIVSEHIHTKQIK